MNVELLKKVKAHILEEPRRLDMRHLHTPHEDLLPGHDVPPCGTVGCIAGWVIVLTKPTVKPANGSMNHYFRDAGNFVFSDYAEEKLGIDDDQAENLFYVGQWPYKFTEAYNEAKTPKERAAVTARRIDHFIKTKGAE